MTRQRRVDLQLSGGNYFYNRQFLFYDPPRANHWRIYINAFNSGPSWSGVNEITMREFSDSENLCVGGTASASVFDTTSQAWSPDRAFNGVTIAADGWLTGNGEEFRFNQWISYEFTDPVFIGYFGIRATADNFSVNGASGPIDFILQYSNDGENWTDASNYTASEWQSLTVKEFINPTQQFEASTQVNLKLEGSTDSLFAPPAYKVGTPIIANSPLVAISAEFSSRHINAPRKELSLSTRYGTTSNADSIIDIPVTIGVKKESDFSFPWSALQAHRKETGFNHSETAVKLERSTSIPWGQLIYINNVWRSGWDGSIQRKDICRIVGAEDGDRTEKEVGQKFTSTRLDILRPDIDHYKPNGMNLIITGGPHHARRRNNYILVGKYNQPNLIPDPPPPSDNEFFPTDNSIGGSFRVKTPVKHAEYCFPWGEGSYNRIDRIYGVYYPVYSGPLIDKDQPTTPPIRTSYTVMNIINAERVSDSLAIELFNVSISLDVDSWAWVFSGTVKGKAAIDAIKPTSSPVDIRVTINGHEFIFMIEGYSGKRETNEKGVTNDYNVKGVSRIQYLAAPYAPKRSKIETNAILARQAAEDELEFTGYTLNWPIVGDEVTPDWLLPASAFAYAEKTPIEVIKAIADAAGAIVIPSMNSDELTIQPRFKILPWQLDEAIVDAIIVESMVRSVGEDFQPGELYNESYVSGTSHGRGSNIRRTGTAGDKPAPDVFDDFQTAIECNRARGSSIIAGSGNSNIYSISLFLPEEANAPGLVLPGMVIEYQSTSETWRGYVLQTSIKAGGTGAAPVWQDLKILRMLDHA